MNKVEKIDSLSLFRDVDEDVDYEGSTHLVCVPRSQEIKDSSNASSTMKVNIEGMRCQSCVKNIEGTIGSRPEILSIKIILEEKLGYIEYKANEITPEKLVETIEDMGFTASLFKEESNSIEKKQINHISQSNISTCSIHIDGMTCMSCVKTITGK